MKRMPFLISLVVGLFLVQDGLLAQKLGIAAGAPSPEKLKELGVDFGVNILRVLPRSPAEKAGIKVGDLLLTVDGRKVTGLGDLVEILGAKKAGDRVKLEILRGGERLSIEVTLGETSGAAPAEPPAGAERRAFLGVGYGDVPAVLAVHLRLDPGVGVLVGDVRPGSAAERAGIVRYDVIVKLDGETVKGPRGLIDLIGRARPGDELSVELIHEGRPVTKKVTLDERPRGLPPSRFGPGDPWERFPRPFWPRGPWRGRLKLGDDLDLEIPWSDRGFDDLRKRLESGGFDDGIRERIEEALKDFDSERTSENRYRLRVIEGDLDVTVTRDDGTKRVTVKKDGETIAEDLPYDKLDTLPDDIEERVRALTEHDFELEPPPGPTLELKPDEIRRSGSVKI